VSDRSRPAREADAGSACHDGLSGTC
jgi:hypothetical protein